MIPSDQPLDEDDLRAEQLFLAARQERPSERVKQRALSLALEPDAPARLSPVRRLLAAALLVATGGVIVASRQTDSLSTPISAERAPVRKVSAAAAPMPPPSAAEPGAPLARAKSVAETRTARPKARTPTLEEELELLDRVRRALVGRDAAAALEDLAEYDRVATGRQLGLEAGLLRIQALAQAGLALDASNLATEFVRQHPDSPLSDRAKSFIVAANTTEPQGPSP